MKDPQSLQSFKKGSWWVVKGPWEHLSNLIDYLRYGRAGLTLKILEVGDKKNTENACFFMTGDPIVVGIVSFFGNPKGRNFLVSSAKKIAEASRRLVRKSADKVKGIAISQSIMEAIQIAEDKNDLKALRVLRDFSVMLVSNCLGSEIPALNPFMSSASETIRFAEYVNHQGPRALALAKIVDPWINGSEIKEFKRRHLERHFSKYGSTTGLVAIGRPFEDPEEYLREAINLIRNSESKKMMYYYRGKKPSLGYFLEKKGKFLWTAVNKDRIVAFRPLRKKAIADSEVFNGLYRVC